MGERAVRQPKRAPAERAGRYEIQGELASGGMGTVYRGFDRLAQRPVAYKRIKVVSESARSRLAALFKREYDTLAHLTHPNIVEVYDYGLDGFGPYYTMELLSGDDLTDLAPLPIDRACRIMRDVASALALLHARRMVHRDVSPNNVRMTADGRAKLIDFGGLTPFGSPAEVVGTPAFIAPECLSDAALDGRTDLYALGALAYWTLTGRTQLRARTLEALVDAWNDPVAPPSQVVPEVPPALDDLVMSLLSHDPQARPATAAHVIARLTAIAGLAPEDEEQKVAYSYLQYAPLRGREQVLADLTVALDSAMRGQGEVVLLECEPGLGRTAVLDQLAVEAQLAGATVVRAQGSLHNSPFSAARNLAEAGLGIFPDVAQRTRMLSSYFSPEAGGTGPRLVAKSSIDMSEHQARLSAHLEDALFQLSLRNPLVLLVDDAHTIDAESLALFAAMLEGLGGHPLLLVISTQVGAATRQPQAYAKLASSAKRSRLAPLTEAQTNELVVTMFGGVPNSHPLAHWLHTQTGGNPAHSIDLARRLLSEGKIRYTVGTFTLPYEFGDVSADGRYGGELLSSLDGLGVEAGKLAGLLAAHPGPLSAEQLEVASGLALPDVLRVMGPLTQRGFAVANGDQYSCASESLRSALRTARPEAEMRENHRALARALSVRDLDVLEFRLAVAHHLLAAGGEDAFEGACLLARTKDENKFLLASTRSSLTLLEQAFDLLEQRGFTDMDCVGLLIPLSVAGFYGEVEFQRRYLDRTMRALSTLCGIDMAKRWSRLLGPKLGLVLGMLAGFVLYSLRRRTINSRSFVQAVEGFAGIPGAANAATAVMWDVPSSYAITAWLDPFEHASQRSVMYLLRAFCLANADVVAVKLQLSAKRYADLFEIFQKPVQGLDDVHAEQFRCGCLHGQGQALVTDCSPEALAIADQLQERSTFFAPHAEGIRMTYYAYRGESKEAAVYRERAEALSFRGGTAWSALGQLTLRQLQACILSGDVVGLVHVMADLKRFGAGLPHLENLYAITEGHLEQLRGHPERALPIYEEAFASPHAIHLPSYVVERSWHAQALSAVGEFARAKALCLELLAETERSGKDGEHIFLSVREQLALAEAGLGNFAAAIEVLEPCFARAGRFENPRSLGGVHRVRATIAALAGDKAGFDEHFAAMSELYRATNNPWLLEQCDVLRAQAVRLGVAPPLAKISGEAGDMDGATAMVTKDQADEEDGPQVSGQRARKVGGG